MALFMKTLMLLEYEKSSSLLSEEPDNATDANCVGGFCSGAP